MSLMSTSSADPAAPRTLVYNFSLTGRGERSAQIWRGRYVSIVVEVDSNGTPCIRCSRPVRLALTRALDSVYETFQSLTGFTPMPQEIAPLPLQVPMDNAGAGGLAGHGIGGISVGAQLVQAMCTRWESACKHGTSWLPGRSVSGICKFGENTPKDASIDQVFLYEMNRNFWPPWFNRKFDWACDGNDSCWGWWTVAMNNAMAIIIPTLLRMPFYYFGHSMSNFRHGMVSHLEYYCNVFCQNDETVDKFQAAWCKSRLPWKLDVSVNDLMTGLIVRSFEQFGGETWIKGLFRELKRVPDINETDAGSYNFQAARDNICKIWSHAAHADLTRVFISELCWEVSKGVCDDIRAAYPTNCCLSLGLS